MRWGHGTPIETLRWSMAERFGWTLDYIDSLSLEVLHEFLQIEDGRSKARDEEAWLKKNRSGK